MLKRLFIFLVFNFLALAVAGLFTSKGVLSDWYANLNKAPWTPPSWCFGMAWSLIMVCFAFYMAYLLPLVYKKQLLVLYGVQLVLNVLWSPVFFESHLTKIALSILILLTILIGLMMLRYWKFLKAKSLFLLPYLLWLLVAVSLNGVVVWGN